MIQLILVLVIVGIAVGISVYRTVRFFRHPLRGCEGCSMKCSGCSLEELHKAVEAKKMKENSFS